MESKDIPFKVAGESSVGAFVAISSEPLINALHRRAIELMVLAYIAALVYMSFVPFDFVRHPASPAGAFWELAFRPFNLRDILANIAIFVPVGAGVYAILRRRGTGCLFSGLLAVVAACILSFSIEFGQRWVASRVSTWVDVTANGLGAMVGAVLVLIGEPQIRRAAREARRAVRRNWTLALAQGAMCLLLLTQLRPYDVVVDVFHTAAAVRHADFSPLATWNALPQQVQQEVREGQRVGLSELPRVQWEYGLDCVVDTCAYAAVAFLLILGLASPNRSRIGIYAWTGCVIMVLAGAITVIRIFLISHGLDTAQLVCGLMGWMLGGLLAGWAWQNSTDQSAPANETDLTQTTAAALSPVVSQRDDRRLGSSRWPGVGIALLMAAVAMYELVPFDFWPNSGDGPSPAHVRQVCMVPFLAHFHARPNDAFYDLSGDILRYAALGLALALLFQNYSRMTWRRQLLAVLGLSVLAAAGFESVHLFMASRQTDVTTLVMALVGAFTGAVALRWAQDYRASLMPNMADDLLTSQLIEGETYKPLPTPKKGSETETVPKDESVGSRHST